MDNQKLQPGCPRDNHLFFLICTVVHMHLPEKLSVINQYQTISNKRVQENIFAEDIYVNRLQKHVTSGSKQLFLQVFFNINGSIICWFKMKDFRKILYEQILKACHIGFKIAIPVGFFNIYFNGSIICWFKMKDFRKILYEQISKACHIGFKISIPVGLFQHNISTAALFVGLK